MKNKLALNASFILLFAIILSNTTFGQSQKDMQLVKDVVSAYNDDCNGGGFKNVGSYAAKDWEHINPAGGVTKGRDSVTNELRPLFQTILKGVTYTIESCDVRFLSPTVSIVNAVHKSGDYEFPQGVIHHNERHMKTYVVVKQQGKWLLALDQNTIIVAH